MRSAKQEEGCTTVKTAVPTSCKTALKSIRQQFRRCSHRYSPIYHTLWEPQSTEQAMPEGDPGRLSGVGDAFRTANNFDLPYNWRFWHEPWGSRYFGCYYGDDGAGFDEYLRLEESAYLALCELDPGLPTAERKNGWIEFLHFVAHRHPTPLLRSSSAEWNYWECWFDADHKRWAKTQNGAPYPLHPVNFTLEHDVVTSSTAAIDLLLSEDGAFLISDWSARLPVRLSSVSVSKPNRDEDPILALICTAANSSNSTVIIDRPTAAANGLPSPYSGAARPPSHPHVGTPLKPTWNPARRELRWGDSLVKRFRQPSENQERVLSAFQEEGWPDRIDDPLPMKPGTSPKRRLGDTVVALNKKHVTKGVIKFERDGTGEGVLWSRPTSSADLQAF